MKRLLAPVLAFILAVVACRGAPTATPDRGPTPKVTQPPGVAAQPTWAATPAAPGTLFSVGQQVQAGNWLFTVTDVQYHKTLEFEESSVTTTGIFCVVFLDVQNLASDTRFFDELRWELLDSSGNRYDADVTSFIAAAQFEAEGSPWDNLGPGQTARIVIAFDVPQEEGVRMLFLYSHALGRPFVWLGYAP